ncbi:MAG: HAD-IB family phosphatase [Firmicutes bacterium]|jgi:2-hydroxy-3-keto-5-methylthiopentenyl-1-phosphate phosphatase|nr:HAD-IB family phosphatase [Bacillota bacterium]
MRQPIAFLCDFDGTIGLIDVGDLVLDNLVFPKLDPAFLRKLEVSGSGSKDLYMQWYGNAPPSQEEFVELILQADIDDSFKTLLDLAKEQGDQVAIVSDGFDAYIKPLLRRANITGVPVYSNVMRFNPELELAFPHHNPSCRFCAVCKAAIALQYTRRGFYTVYVGDGTSDRFPIHAAHQVFAKDALVPICEEEGIPFDEFSSFQDIISWYAAGEVRQEKPLDLHPKCSSLKDDSLKFLDVERAANLLSEDVLEQD